MKRILIFASLLLLPLLPCQAGAVSDLLTVNLASGGAEYISLGEDGTLGGINFGVLGGSGTGCAPDATFCLISGSEDPYALYFVNDSSLPDPTQAGLYTVLTESDGTFSDMFGIFQTGTDPNSNPIYSLGFYASATGIPSPWQGAVGASNFVEPANGSTYILTSLLNPDAQAAGDTAYFEDDSAPEPATLVLLGIGLAAFGLRRRILA